MPSSDSPRSRKACCLISEVLEEAGIDRAKARALRRQLLQGIVLLCQWQLQRMDEAPPKGGASKRGRKARKVEVE